MKKLYLSVVLFAFWGCSNNMNPPEYIKEVVAYKEGSDGILIYLVLADKSGAPTSSDGLLGCTIESKRKLSEGYAVALSEVKQIKAENFSELTVGTGPFEKKVLGYSLGRIPYSQFNKSGSWTEFPDLILPKGKVSLTFTIKGGKELENSTDISF